MFLLRRLPSRRMELLFSLMVLFAFYAMAGWSSDKSQEIGYWLALLSLELLLPLAAGVLAAGSLAGDPALDILLTAYRPAWQVMIERLLLTGAIGALLGAAALLLAQQWEVMLPKNGSDQIFIWLSPMVFCMGIANCAALLRGRVLDGAMAVLGAMGSMLLAQPLFQNACVQSEAGGPCAWWLLNPLMTLGSAQDSFWPLNRLLWLAIGAALVAWSVKLAQREVQLLHPASTE